MMLLLGVQLIAVLFGLGSANYVHMGRIVADLRKLKQVHPPYRNRFEGPIAIRARRYELVEFGSLATLLGLLAVAIFGRGTWVTALVSTFVAGGSVTMALLLRYEFIKSDDLRQRLSHSKANWSPNVTDFDEAKSRMRPAA